MIRTKPNLGGIMSPRTILTTLILTLALGAFAASPALARNACKPIMNACTKAGYSKGGGAGKSLMHDCLDPILNGKGGSAGLPSINAATISACKASQTKKTSGKLAPAADAATVPTAAKAMPASQTSLPPNIVMVLVDDLSLNLLTGDQDILQKSMPNVAQMMKDGASFTNYFVTDSLCCPSRTSIFTGMLPHNSKVFTNNPPNGGFEAFMQNGDDGKSFAIPLHNAFYQTAMMGKYLNGYVPDQNGAPQGWSEWAVAGNGYPNFNYALNHDGVQIRSPLHLTDELSDLGQAFLRKSVAAPFFLEVATFSPHSPYVPPARYKDAFPEIKYPVGKSYDARPDAAAPGWLKEIPALNPTDGPQIEDAFRNRVRSDKGIDDMVGALRKTLTELGVADRTYVIFTSDNGYHMGEYSLMPGKQTPFDTDIQVPLVIVGPGIAAGKTIDATTMNIDFYPTFAEWSGSPANPEVDGHSLAGLLQGKASGAWRSVALVEHRHDGGKTPDNPDKPAKRSGNPPDYTAMRMPGAMYVEYQNSPDTIGYYDLKADPLELHNIAGSLSADKKKALHDAMTANVACKGATECWAAQSLTP